ncbi:MAG TPA: acyltransferase [Kofleriaceae bacterium]|nr:acyltransferase [Kofleriaceae bacterium]
MDDDRIDFIQALRGIAALLVVFFHAHFFVDNASFRAWSERYFGSGAIGVDLFFVISGFIMVHTTTRAPATARSGVRFLARRLARVWPVYAAHTIFYVLLIHGHDGLPGEHVAWTKLERSLAFYPQQVTDEPMLGFPSLGVGWTLNYEAWFYLLFAASMFAGTRRWAVFFGALAATLVALPLALAGDLRWSAFGSYHAGSPMLALVMNPMIWEFGAGVGIALLYRSRVRLRSPIARGVLLVATAAFVLVRYFDGNPLVYGPSRGGLPVALFVLALTLQHKERRITIPKPMLWLGEISFSLYLVQRLPQKALMTNFKDESFFHTITWFWLGSLVAIALATISYFVLERGLSERVRKWLLAVL